MNDQELIVAVGNSNMESEAKAEIVESIRGEFKENKEGYNGWKNYETWDVKLWIDNEESDYEYWHERAKEIREEEEEYPILSLADEMKEFYDENNPLPEAGVYTDLLNAALGEVDWYEIAEHIMEEIEEETEKEER